MLCYVLSTILIVCDRGDSEDRHLLRAGTTLSSDTKALLETRSRVYTLAYTAQLIFLIWLVKTSVYTCTVHKVVETTFGIFCPHIWLYTCLRP
jgi:hypothetical protein